mgnify:FL=1
MGRISWSDIIFWLALLVLLVWIILKGFGIINSPAIMEIIPYISGIFIAGAVWQQFRNMQNDLHQIKGATRRLLRVEHEHNLFMDGKLNHKRN